MLEVGVLHTEESIHSGLDRSYTRSCDRSMQYTLLHPRSDQLLTVEPTEIKVVSTCDDD